MCVFSASESAESALWSTEKSTKREQGVRQHEIESKRHDGGVKFECTWVFGVRCDGHTAAPARLLRHVLFFLFNCTNFRWANDGFGVSIHGGGDGGY